MEGSDGSPPSSLWMIRAAELFPKPPMEKEDEQLTVHIQELAGESVRFLGRTDDGVLALTNYRLFLLKNSTCSETSIPLGLIESAQNRDLFHLVINCKDASTVKCSFETAEQCAEWQRRISLSVGVPETLEALFAFPFYSWTSDSIRNENNEWAGRLQRAGRYEDDFRKEVERLQFDLNGTWRISNANAEYKLCPSYPPLILVPCCISDETLHNVSNFRGSRRLPAVVWRHKQSGAVLARSSQPEVGWLGWRSSKDEQLLKALADACAFDRGEQNRRQNLCTSGESTPSSAEGSHEEVCMDEVRKILIVDARSYTSAVTNRARGGGCECIDYYPCAEIEFMNLGNIHAIRKSFHALRQLCASPPDIPNWLGLLERTMWLQHLSGLLAASMTVCHAIEKKGRPVLVHCSDGWDRTPQIVATAQLCLDPYYRTVEGFRILVEREWLSYGHKFADRCGHGPGSDELNERCPVFLQWLDLVHQIHVQSPCSFEFSMAYLIKLAQHSHSCLFGTFLCNTVKERQANSVFERTFSVWPFLSGPIYRNPLYVPNRDKVLWPAHNVRDLTLWSEVYLGSLGNQNSTDYPTNSTEGSQESKSPMTKTRSYGDLMTAGEPINGLTRRSSDPNMAVESHLMMPINISDNNSVSSDLHGSPDIIKNMFHDTTEKLNILTNELNQSDEDAEICKINNFNHRENQKNTSYQLDAVEKQTNTDCDISNGTSGNENQFVTNSSLYDTNNIEQYINENSKCIAKSNKDSDTVDFDSDDIGVIDSDMMQSVDLHDGRSSSPLNKSTESLNAWYGSNDTSTDTLVPTEMQQVNIITNGTDVSYSNIPEEMNGCTTGDMVDQGTFCLDTQKRGSCNIFTDLPKMHSNTQFANSNVNLTMDESILILPEHQRLEISNSGKCDTVSNIINASSSDSRRRTSLSNSKNGVTSPNRNFCGSTTNSRFSTPGVKSLPLTPPGGSDRPPVVISCPDGLAHALSEQNLRLQQIVYEHKLREDALQRELYGMRMALLKKTCLNCNNQSLPNDEQSLILDNIENISICSWEAVEDRSGPSSGANSAQLGGVLWVPDHAVSRCTSCQTEFWLGRRKHHCRSCGQIFCADCSEFSAPLPDERFYEPVRLCGPCYHAVTTRIQHQQQSRSCANSNHSHYQNQTSTSSSTLVSGIPVNLHHSSPNTCSAVPTSIEACKHAANPPRNDRGRYKAAAASN